MKAVRAAIIAVLLFLSSCASLTANDTRTFVHSVSNGSMVCSAVVLRPGLALTASHCIVEGLALNGAAGTVLRSGDDRLDLALIAFPSAACPCARIADREADVDEPVYVVGYPRGIAQVVTYGVSQGVHNNSRLPFGGPRLVLAAAVDGGNSGGGVFVLRDGEYQLVGILVEGLGPLSFAMPLVEIRPFIAGRV